MVFFEYIGAVRGRVDHDAFPYDNDQCRNNVNRVLFLVLALIRLARTVYPQNITTGTPGGIESMRAT
jgi:hypothetical protein